MLRTLLKSKIHRATVTEADLHYEGSITIDSSLLEAAGLVEYEQVDVYNITNGQRLTTYAIVGEAGSGVICMNGAAAHRAKPGDRIIIAAYAQFDEAEVAEHKPRVIVVVRTTGSNRSRSPDDPIWHARKNQQRRGPAIQSLAVSGYRRCWPRPVSPADVNARP